ncbi:MAG: threonine--tRNA ligase, partial [Candidatus Thermoplasmatota archaeon]
KNVFFDMEKKIASYGYEVLRAPFGWYKSFELSCKGHPLSELSKEIKGEEKEEVSEALKKEEEIKTKFYVFHNDLIDIEKFDYKNFENFKKFVDYETKKIREYGKEPIHIKLMKEHELLNFEPGSDAGNFRWYPKGRLIKKLLENYVTDICIGYGAMEVETPIMYDYKHPSLRKYLERFPARQYTIRSDDKDFFLRFSACFGQFLMSHDANISYRSLPLKMFELTKYSFRREKSGELCGIKRLRGFTMPDMHTLCADLEKAKEEYERQFELCLKWMHSLGLEFETAFRAEKKFYEENKDWFEKLIKKTGKPALIELFDIRYAYFITKFEFNFIDSQDKAGALSTVQIDVENSETYDIYYIDKDGKKKRPIILHTSISGGIERCIYAILENEGIGIMRGKKGELPFWLSPTQIRLIPIDEAYIDDCKNIAMKIKNARIDIDDRTEKVGKKIRDAEMEWIPMIIVFGAKERSKGILPIRHRDGTIKEIRIEELQKEIERMMSDYPFEPLPLPIELSKRAIFVG